MPIARLPRIVVLGAALAGAAWAIVAATHSPRLGRTVALVHGSGDSPTIHAQGNTIATRFSPPTGFERITAPPGSFAAFLRDLPLKPDGSPVRLYDGRPKARQDVHAAVVDLDVGPRDLQQCADSVIRLRAEYLYSVGRADDVAFHFTSGFLCSFARWRLGDRVEVSGSRVAWVPGGAPDASHASLRRYLDMVFTYAGTASLPRDLDLVRDDSPVEPGDVFLRPGSPGHAMIVVDVAAGGAGRAFLLAQGFMPAQDVHVVRNPAASDGNPWYVFRAGEALATPEWTFAWTERRRFRAPR